MEQKNYNVIGVMSGTSLDGIDCAYVHFSMTPSSTQERYPNIQAHIKIGETIPYPDHWQRRLQDAHLLPEEKLDVLNEKYTEHLAEVILEFQRKHGINKIDAVCSHGHTILHQPEQGITLQIGNLPKLATLLRHQVVCDFRVQDVALGGQGAPLVPIGDELLFKEYDYCLNLGGFANISTNQDAIRIAYDVCPVNVVLNKYAQKLGAAYDDGGAFAKAGTINYKLLNELNNLDFYNKSHPKSLGIEWVQDIIFPLLQKSSVSDIDIISTFTEHIAIQLASQFEENTTILVTGGGAYNSYLLERVNKQKTLFLKIPEPEMVEFKEAFIFGLLGVLKLENLPNCLASVTGAQEDHSSGMLYHS